MIQNPYEQNGYYNKKCLYNFAFVYQLAQQHLPRKSKCKLLVLLHFHLTNIMNNESLHNAYNFHWITRCFNPSANGPAQCAKCKYTNTREERIIKITVRELYIIVKINSIIALIADTRCCGQRFGIFNTFKHLHCSNPRS